MFTIVSFFIGLAISVLTWMFPDSGKQLIKDLHGIVETQKWSGHVPNAASVVQSASGLSIAAGNYKDALTSPYAAALGGEDVQSIPYERLTQKVILAKMATFSLMDSIPNVRVIPEDSTPSIGYDMCTDIQAADRQVDEMMTRYNSKIPEILFRDIGNVRATVIYRYFSKFSKNRECNLFLGEIKNKLEERRGTRPASHIFSTYEIPYPIAHLSASDFIEYTTAVEAFDRDTASIASGKMHIGD
jgi:hypothetical protein